MSKKNSPIINPNRTMTKEEEDFISRNRLNQQSRPTVEETKIETPEILITNANSKKKFKAISLTVPVEFHEEIKNFVNKTPSENSVSALLVKAAYEYMKRFKKETSVD